MLSLRIFGYILVQKAANHVASIIDRGDQRLVGGLVDALGRVNTKQAGASG